MSAEDCEEADEYSRCGCCAEDKKLKNCDFCGTLTCPTHLSYQRPYPVDNPSRKKISSQVCFACNSKFLYRDAMFEMMTRMELFDAQSGFYQSELEIAQ